jgi:membrane protein DedA with SNARE-associated domain
MTHWLFVQNGWIIYPSIFLLLLGGAVGLPIPEDLPLLAAGFAIHRAVANFWPIFILSYTGVLIGDLILYYIGYRIGPKVFRSRRIRRRLHPRRILSIQNKLERHCVAMIIIARHLFYFRSVTFLMCGAIKIPVWKFVLVDAIAALFSVTIMMYLGYTASENLGFIISIFEKARLVTGILIIVLLCSFGFCFYRKSRAKRLMP